MSIVRHEDFPVHTVPRIRTRVLVGPERGAAATAVWEQWLDPAGYIPVHYHEVEEVLVFLAGEVAFTLDGRTTSLRAPASAVIPPRAPHGLRPTGSETVHLLAFFPTPTPKIFAVDGRPRPMPWEDTAESEPP